MEAFELPSERVASIEFQAGTEAMEGSRDISPPPNLAHMSSIGEDEANRLKDLATDVRDQDDLERDINRQADDMLNAQAIEREQKRLEKTEAEKE